MLVLVEGFSSICKYFVLQGVTSPLAGQMFFRASMFSAFGAAKRYFATNPDGTTRQLTTADFYKVTFTFWPWTDSVGSIWKSVAET